MNLEALVSESLVERLGWTLLHFVWQGALVAAVLVMALAMLRRHSAAARYVAACVALLSMTLLPIATFCAGSPPTPTPSPHPAPDANAAPVPTGTAGRSGQDHAPGLTALEATTEPQVSAPATSVSLGLPRPLQWRVSGFLQPLLPWAVFTWFIGTLVLSVRLSGGWALAQCLRGMAVRPTGERLQGTLRQLCERLRVSRPVQLLESGLAQVPTVVGWLRPVILLPASAASGLTPAQLEAILAHELAHIRRHDYLVNLFQSIAEVLLFYHPAVWWVSSRIRIEREHCCDDMAVGLCRDPVLYARSLTELEFLRAPSPEPTVAATGGALLSRVRRLVGPPRAAAVPSSWPAGILALVLLTALLIPLLSSGRGVAQQALGNVMEMPGVVLVAEDGVREGYPEAIAAVVSSAKEAFDRLFPELAKPGIRVEVSPAPGWYEHTTTDRHSTMYVRVGGKGLGEYFRPDADAPVILCEAVAELHNPVRLPGFDRYIAHRHLVPAVLEQLGPEPLPGTDPGLGEGDVTGMLAVMTDPIYAAAHPDFAAVSVLVAIEREVGLEELRGMLLSSLSADRDPFAALREFALAKAPALAEAFALYDEADTVTVEEDGTCLVASFEADEAVTQSNPPALPGAGEMILYLSNELVMSQAAEWSTHGELSLKLQADQVRNYLGLHVVDPDWKFKDWTRFSKFELDLMLHADEGQVVRVYVADHVASAHGLLPALPDTELQPGEQLHVAYHLTESSLRGKASTTLVPYFDGQVRAREIADIQITVPRPTGPFTLYVDNIRLTPRAGVQPADRPTPAADQARADELRQMQMQAQAAALVKQALAHKGAGQLQRAEASLRKALELQPESVEAHRVLAWVLVDLERREEAAAEFGKVIDLTDDDRVRQEAERALERVK